MVESGLNVQATEIQGGQKALTRNQKNKYVICVHRTQINSKLLTILKMLVHTYKVKQNGIVYK